MARTRRGFLDGYPTYDDSEGRGSPEEWQSAFNERMGLDEAARILGDDEPLAILGLQAGATADDIKKAWRREAMKWHPDRNGGSADCAEKFIRAQAAYVKLTGSR